MSVYNSDHDSNKTCPGAPRKQAKPGLTSHEPSPTPMPTYPVMPDRNTSLSYHERHAPYKFLIFSIIGLCPQIDLLVDNVTSSFLFHDHNILMTRLKRYNCHGLLHHGLIIQLNPQEVDLNLAVYRFLAALKCIKCSEECVIIKGQVFSQMNMIL